MFKSIIAGSKLESVVSGRWKAGLVLAAALLLSAACTTVVDVASTPPEPETPTRVGDGATPPPTPETGTPNPKSDERTVQRIPDTPVPAPAKVLPVNTLGLVLAVSGGSSSGTLKTLVTTPGTNKVTSTAFINLESSSKSVIFYRSDTRNATVIDSYSSPSYAPHFKRLYMVDDRLFVSNKCTNGGAMTITEYATDEFNRKSEWGTQDDALGPGYAVAGGEVYSKTGSTEQWSMSRGFYNAPGDYMRSPFNSQSDSTEMTKPELGFALISGVDTLYGAKLSTEADPITGVFVVDPNTGQRADEYLTAFEVED